MKSIYSTFFVLYLMAAACQPGGSHDNQIKAIEGLRTRLSNQKGTQIDTVTANQLIEKSLTFVAAFPKDTLAPAFLFQAADVSRGIGKGEEAVRLWGRVQADYPGYERAADALFLQGFTCENNLLDETRAVAYYQAFLDKYPKHPLFNDVSLSIEYLKSGKAMEELIKSFKKPSNE